MRRSQALAAFGAAALLLGLAGCAEPEAPAPLPAAERWVTPDPAVLAEGSFRWHETGTGVANALEYYDLASQAVAHPCVWDSGSGEEVYFNNLELPTGPGSRALGPWSGNLTVTLDWTDQDWIGTALRVAYQAPGLEGWHETAPIERGSTLTVPVRVPAANGTGMQGEAGAEAEEADGASDWSVWVCLGDDSLTGPPEPFVGSVQARLVFQPDPIREPVATEAAGPEGRTARDG
jgi:hypothetical protein